MKHLPIFLLVLFALTLGHTSTAQTIRAEGIWFNYSKANSGLQGDSVTSIAFDNSGNTWIGCFPGGLAKFDGAHWTTYTDFSNVPSNDINALLFLNGTLWIGTAQGLTKYDGTNWQTYTPENSQLAGSSVNCLAADATGNIWIGTSSGLSELKANATWSTFNETNIPIWPDEHIYAVTTAGSDVWVAFGSAYGMSHFNPNNLSTAKMVTQDTFADFPADHIGCIAQDWSGNIWGTSEYYGVVKLAGSSVTHYYSGTDQSFINDHAHAVAVDRCGHVWIGTEGGAAKMVGSTWNKFTAASSPLGNNFIQCISVDAAGHVWFGTHGGVTEFKPIPEPVSLATPANAAIVQNDTVQCQWNWACPGILKYWYEIADNAAFTNSRVDTTSQSLTQSASYLETNLVNRKTYYWRAMAKNDAGWGPFSPTWSFTYIMPVPSKPMLMWPANGSTIHTDTITSRWTTSTPHVQKYWYELGDDAVFTHSVIDTITSSDASITSHFNQNLLNGKTIYWRVKAENVEGWGTMSDVWSFTYTRSSGVALQSVYDCELALYPNPTSNGVTALLTLPHRETFSIAIFDESGAQVMTPRTFTKDAGLCNVSLDIEQLKANGVYRVVITADDFNASTALVIAR
jgi:hypothetical protein